jgi:hypothetical protein
MKEELDAEERKREEETRKEGLNSPPFFFLPIIN